MSLKAYLSDIRRAVEKLDLYGFAERAVIQEELRAGKQASVYIVVVLVDGSKLIIREYVDAYYKDYKVERIRYAYHYQSEDGTLVFRYDNARHKPDPGFVEHKHTADGHLEAHPAPSVAEIVEKVIRCL